jgi:hypothetical protein
MATGFNPDHLEKLFPNLKSTGYNVTSPYDPNYNCIAWAAGDTSVWWEPDPMGVCYWPRGVPRAYSVKAYRAAYRKIGYKDVSDENLDPALNKVAIYTKQGYPMHAARQLDDGRWTSKLGKNVDIEHDIRGLDGIQYGTVEIILKKDK